MEKQWLVEIVTIVVGGVVAIFETRRRRRKKKREEEEAEVKRKAIENAREYNDVLNQN